MAARRAPRPIPHSWGVGMCPVDAMLYVLPAYTENSMDCPVHGVPVSIRPWAERLEQFYPNWVGKICLMRHGQVIPLGSLEDAVLWDRFLEIERQVAATAHGKGAVDEHP
jgi:hypothetical protein